MIDRGLRLVREFHEAADQPVRDEPTLVDGDTSELRITLLAEELRELAESLGVRLTYEVQLTDDPGADDPAATLKELCDVQYVLDGAFLSLGFHRYKSAALEEVHRSNLSKIHPDGTVKKRADGKVLKPDTYSPADMAAILIPRPAGHYPGEECCVCDVCCYCGKEKSNVQEG